MNKPYIMFNEYGTWYHTTRENFTAYLRNARKIQKWDGFETVAEIREYWNKYLGGNFDNDVEVIQSEV